MFLNPSQVEDAMGTSDTFHFTHCVLLKLSSTYLLLGLQISDAAIFGQRRFLSPLGTGN